MVNRVNGQKYYEYTKVSRQKRETTDSPEFHLDHEQQGVIYEKSEKKKAQKVHSEGAEEKPKEVQETSGSGVEWSISREGYESLKQEKTQTASLTEQVQKLAVRVLDFLKTLWDKVWNDTTVRKETEFPEILSERMEQVEEQSHVLDSNPIKEAENIPQTLYTQDEIRAIFRRGDQQEIQDFLSQHGERQLAKNSDLLTQYDRRGSIVGIDRSDKELILHGNRNEIKL